jgi:hypothetical protein
MAKFNHAFDFAVEVISHDEHADDVTPAMLRAALINRATQLSDDGIMEACGLYDSYTISED